MTTEPQEVNQEEQPTAQVRDVKSRRDINLLFGECPLCKLRLTEFDKVKNDEGKQYFQLVQYGANPDGTGYESYYCQSCERFFMMIISSEGIKAEYDFKPAREQPHQGNSVEEIFKQIFGGGNRGERPGGGM